MGMEVSSLDTMVIDTRDTQDTEYGIDITIDTLDTGDIQSTELHSTLILVPLKVLDILQIL